ncbi:MAG: AAA family ATPase [Candidatus Saccharimonas sp.]
MSEHDQNTKIIAFTGLPGAGKSEAVNYLTEKGYPKVYFGGVVLNAMKEQGLEWNEENEKQFREDVRDKEGKDFVVKRIITELHELIGAGQKRVVADGLYTWTEYKLLKHEFPGELIVVAIVAPKHLRHHRLTIRASRPLTVEQANDRDWAEIENLEKGGPIAIADYYIENDGDLVQLHTRVDALLREANF